MTREPRSDERSPMTPSDSAWLRMDRRENRMIITGALMLRGPVPFDQVQAQLAERLAPYRQFRQRVLQPTSRFGSPHWVWDENFSIERHTEYVELCPPADKDALQDFVSARVAEGLPGDRPLWRIYYVDNVAGGAALIARVHHCVGDGMALLHVLLNLSDDLPDMLAPSKAAPWVRASKERSAIKRFLTGAYATASSLGLLAKFLLSPTDPATPFRGEVSGTKRAVWSEPIDLSLIKQIGAAAGATVNDVLLSITTGALRSYLEEAGIDCNGLTLRAVVPVNLRDSEHLSELGNKFGLVFLPLPIGAPTPEARLVAVRTAMERIKRSPEAFVWFALLRAMGRVTPSIESLAVEFLSRKATLVITNVAGPLRTLQFSNSDIRDVMFWVPSAGRVGVGLSIMSYQGKVCIGLATDVARVAEPELIIEAFGRELAQLTASSVGVADELPTPARSAALGLENAMGGAS